MLSEAYPPHHSSNLFSCCNWGEGSYQLAFDGRTIKSGGSFGASETTTFNTPDLGNPTPAPVTPAPVSAEQCYDVSVALNFDSYPSDESWDISQGGTIVASSPAFAAGTVNDVQTVCLPAGDYVYTIYDVYGDGMCCDWGEGSYSVTANGQVIKEGGEFGQSESTSFTIP